MIPVSESYYLVRKFWKMPKYATYLTKIASVLVSLGSFLRLVISNKSESFTGLNARSCARHHLVELGLDYVINLDSLLKCGHPPEGATPSL